MKRRIRKPETLWCFKWADGTLHYSSISFTKREVVKFAENYYGVNWLEIKKHGHRAVKVEIKEVLIESQ